MTRAAGVDVAPTMPLPSSSGDFGHFATQRFDRGEHGERIHRLSAAGLLEAQWEIPTIDSVGSMGATRVLTRN